MALNDWMRSLPDDTRLCEVVLPATHDSGMSFETAGAFWLNPLKHVTTLITGAIAMADDAGSGRTINFTHDNYVTQSSNVAGQLAFGARQLDLRMTRHLMCWRAFHGPALATIAGARRYGEHWKDICPAIASFMKRTDGRELLILKMDKHGEGDTALIKMLNTAFIKEDYRPNLRNVVKRYLDQETVGALRGRVFVCLKPKVWATWRAVGGLHPCLTFCVWDKEEEPHKKHPLELIRPLRADARRGTNEPPVYRLMGSSEGTTGDSSRNILVKQATMKTWFATHDRPRTVGMRGIWFNTLSMLRDIRIFSNEIWSPGKQNERDSLWLSGAARQNVASVDFLDEAKGRYIVGKNLHLGDGALE